MVVIEAKLCIKCGDFCKWVGKSWWIVVGSGDRWGSLVGEIGGMAGRLKLVGFEVKVGGVGVLRRKRLW